jgi:hypothetical protein
MKGIPMRRAGLSVASAVIALAFLVGCADTASREAAPAESAEAVESPSPADGEDAAQDESDEITVDEAALQALTEEELEPPEGERAEGLYRSTRVCFRNEDEVGAWRNYVTWRKYDTKQDANPVFGEQVCAEGTFVTGADVEGAFHLVTQDRSSELVVNVSGTNYFDDEPELELNAPGVSTRDSYREDQSRTFIAQSAGNPRRVIEVKRLADTKWVEFVITARSTRTCDPNGGCAIGDTGPGGGVVVYDAGTTKSWGRYLEVAPIGWSGAADDPQVTWCPASAAGYGTNIGTKREIGDGKANTAAIVSACGTDTAAGRAAAYRGGEKSDWFLPSMGELNQVWQERNSNPVLMPDGARYWTSSQAEVDNQYAIKAAIELTNGNFNEGGAGFYRALMENQRHVRPMRAF